VDEHLRRVAERVVVTAEAVSAGAAPARDLVEGAYAAEAALDNANGAWKRVLWDLALDTDAASTTRPAHADEAAERLAVLTAAAPFLKSLHSLLLP
jgi:hypothetical protein